MYRVFLTFTSDTFREETLGRAESNLAKWRETSAEARRVKEMSKTTHKMMRASLFCVMVCVFFFTRWYCLQGSVERYNKLPPRRGGGGGGVLLLLQGGTTGTRSTRTPDEKKEKTGSLIFGTGVSEKNIAGGEVTIESAVRQVCGEFLTIAFVWLAFAVACMGSVVKNWLSRSRGGALSEEETAVIISSRRYRERLLSLVSAAYVWYRLHVIYRRRTLTTVLSDNGINTSFPFIGANAGGSGFVLPKEEAYALNIVPVLISYAFYSNVQYLSARAHVIVHGIIGLSGHFLVYWNSNNRAEPFAGVFTPRSDEMVDRLETTWIGILLFPVMLFVLDPACRPKIMPTWFAKSQSVGVNIILIATFLRYTVTVFF